MFLGESRMGFESPENVCRVYRSLEAPTVDICQSVFQLKRYLFLEVPFENIACNRKKGTFFLLW